MRPLKPQVETGAAKRWAKEIYGIDCRAEPLPGEIDRNFLLHLTDGERRVLKIAPAAADRVEIECQLAALEHLAHGELGSLVPRVYAADGGQTLHEVRSADGDVLLVRMVGYLAGTPLARRAAVDSELLREIGETLGRLDLAFEPFTHPGAHRKLVWDLVRLLELRPLLPAVDPGLRPLVAAGLDRFSLRVSPRIDELPRSVIHNDANDHNLLVADDDDGTTRLRGLIDFGDMVHSITVAELAITCAYAMLDTEDPWAVAGALTEGYEKARPLQPLERELLPDLIVGRLCASLLFSAQARQQSPDDDYLTVSERPAAELLRRLGNSARTTEAILETRRAHLGPNLSVSYRRPLQIVRGEGAYLFDESGRRYVDLVNNVCHVGHCHPRVVEAGRRQMATLNTNSRYLHANLADYVERLAATMPGPLSVCYLACTGTEANDLALRLARAHTGSREIVVLDHAYHGHSPSLIELSPYKCDGPGGEGLAAHARKAPCPDTYRGKHRGQDAGARYAQEVAGALETMKTPGAFMAESLVGCGGQIVPPDGFFEGAYTAARAAGAVCIADEVQVGFGRVGSHMWAFESHGVVPDIVTLGKPIGNGHPLAAVVTTPEIAASFDNGMEYFNTFGGNPVSCAIGLAVLRVIEEEQLREYASAMGARFLAGLVDLANRHERIGDIRGRGLFLGIELVRDRDTRAPDAPAAGRLVETMRDRGFLLSTDGPDHNVIKIKPPLAIAADDIDATLEALDGALGTDTTR
jgi:4-aminobutyrate aminotransferase-like enzyme